MKFLSRISVVALGVLLASGAQSQVLFSFEDDLQGFNSSGAMLTQDTQGATHGTYSMSAVWPGGFTWLFGGSTSGLAAVLAQNRVLLADISAPPGGNPAPWASTFISFNDPLGWRQTDVEPGLPLVAGTRTVAYDYRALTPPDPNSPWFQLNIAINAGGGPNTVYFDNIRPLDETKTLTVLSFEEDLHGFNSSVATLTQDTIGATHGTHSMRVEWPGGFTWLFGGSAPGLAAALKEGKVLLMDLTVAPGGTPPPWANLIISFNDPIGWRQTSPAAVGIPRTEGTRTIAVDYRELTPPDPNSPWFQLNIGINAGGAHTFYVDNIRVLRAPRGDVDGNLCVNDKDLWGALLEFGGSESGDFGDTDLNNDGVVDNTDLAEVTSYFGHGCSG